MTALEARADQLADRLIEAERRIADERERAAAAEKELQILRDMYEAATNPDPGRKMTFWEWVRSGRK